VLVARESPLSEIHLDNMLALAKMGSTILPPMPAFYSNPKSIDDMVDHIIGRLLDQFSLDMPGMNRWNGFEGNGSQT
jgi:4-hydroxy-3-polyprenylbenzoate decarboxylase